MPSREDQIAKLKKLIRESGSFGENEKNKILEHVTELNDSDLEKAIGIFGWEKEEWIKIKNKSDNYLKGIGIFAKKSEEKLARMARQMIHEKEKSETEEETEKAENLLKII